MSRRAAVTATLALARIGGGGLVATATAVAAGAVLPVLAGQSALYFGDER